MPRLRIPRFEVIPALRSRMRIYILNELSKDDLNNILDRVLENDPVISKKVIDEIDRDFLFYISGGDARNMLNVLEAVVNSQKDANV